MISRKASIYCVIKPRWGGLTQRVLDALQSFISFQLTLPNVLAYIAGINEVLRLSRCVYVLINFSYWDQLREWDCTQKSQEKLIKGRAMKSNLGASTQGKVLKGICSTGPAQLVCLLTSSFLNVNLRALLLLLPVLWQRKNAPHKTTFLFPYSLVQLNGAEPKLPLPNTQSIHFSHRAEPWEQDLGCWLLCSSPSLCRADSAAGWAQQSHPEQLQFPQQENAASLGHSRLCSRFSPSALLHAWSCRESILPCAPRALQGAWTDLNRVTALHLFLLIHCQGQDPGFSNKAAAVVSF